MKFRSTVTMAFIFCVGMLAGVQGAAATEYKAVYTGTILSGNDVTGLFGTPGMDLTGQAFTAFFIYDPSLGTTNIDGTNHIQLIGGASFGTTSPGIEAGLTINGFTFLIDPNDSADIVANPAAGQFFAVYNEFKHTATDDISNGLMGIVTGDPAIPLSITTPITLTNPGNFNPFFEFQDYSNVTNSQVYTVVGSLHADSVTVSQISVPEPVSLSVFGAGLAGAFAMRRRKKAA